jgi:cobalt/nickel transport system ATP-binding protein
VINIRGLVFRYASGAVVFDGLDFDFTKGQKLGLEGANGAGKTTLFHIIMGLLRPDAGELAILGKKRVHERDFDEVRRNIGFLFQDADDQLFCPTVIEDVAFGPLNLGKSHDEAERIAMNTLRSLGLSGYESRITYQLSGGEKKLVSLATVLAMEPSALLLDEPTAGLDEKTTRRLVEVLNERVGSFIVISHDAQFLKETATAVVRLEGGKIVC